MSLYKRQSIPRNEHEKILLMTKFHAEGKFPANLPQPFIVLKNHLEGFCTYLESFGYSHVEALCQRSILHRFDRWLAANSIREFIPDKSEEYIQQIPNPKHISYRKAIFLYKSFLEDTPIEPKKTRLRENFMEDQLLYPRRCALKLDKKKYKKWISEHQSILKKRTYQILYSESKRFMMCLKKKGYSKMYIAQSMSILGYLDDFLVQKGIRSYSPKIYEEIADEYLGTITNKVKAKNVIRLFNNVLLHKPLIVTKQKKQPEPISKSLEYLLKKYGQNRLNYGNHPSTVSKKIKLAREFLRNCSISEIKELTPEIISHAVSITKNKDEWNYAKIFLTYCYDNKIIKKKYGELIPMYKAPKKLPSTYSMDEIASIEFSVDRETSRGKRDYALLLLATRLGLRSCDIVGMKFEYLDFENNKIKLFQQKTGKYVELEMLDIIKEALQDYIKNARPLKKNAYVFLSCLTPHNPITTGVIRCSVVKKYMSIAKISTAGKKHGPHSLRASLATSMVNDNVPFEAVSKILGHSSKETIQRYAKLDIEHLRACSVEVNPATGKFKFWLEGGVYEQQ